MDDLDADLAKFEEELRVLEQGSEVVSGQADGGNKEYGGGNVDGAGRVAGGGAVVGVSSTKGTSGVTATPSWQRELAERDFRLLQARRSEAEKDDQLRAEAERRAAAKGGQWEWDEKRGEWFWKEKRTPLATESLQVNSTGPTMTIATTSPMTTTSTLKSTVVSAMGPTSASSVGIGSLHSVGSMVTPATGGTLEEQRNLTSSSMEPNAVELVRGRQKAVRTAAGTVWIDPTMEAWPENDFRIFVGDLGGDTTDETLRMAFERFPSYNMSRVVYDKRTKKCKGFGFVSFGKGEDMIHAMKEMNGKYIGSRPCKLRKSNWKERAMTEGRHKDLRALKKFTKSFPAKRK
uniref:RRM domain-containing protein n=1 Tax=Compsopogon caeruleus TaxID=31354 RepID=A0A6T6BX83_9RHOD|mmetsp:Transcript_16071/g.32375  ORF Transcript_16071/g.32375 Transcript_16071/m.32375 type:complete len:347 (+) Transcript_16071:251-1291(+)